MDCTISRTIYTKIHCPLRVPLLFLPPKMYIMPVLHAIQQPPCCFFHLLAVVVLNASPLMFLPVYSALILQGNTGQELGKTRALAPAVHVKAITTVPQTPMDAYTLLSLIKIYSPYSCFFLMHHINLLVAEECGLHTSFSLRLAF